VEKLQRDQKWAHATRLGPKVEDGRNLAKDGVKMTLSLAFGSVTSFFRIKVCVFLEND